MLIGEYAHSIDAKGRLIMPAKLKEDIGEKFVITKGLDGCLFVYSQKEWQNFEEKIKDLPTYQQRCKSINEIFLSRSNGMRNR